MVISVVTISKNNPALLETIVSVRAQKSAKIQHIIIDGASTDDSFVAATKLPNTNPNSAVDTIMVSEPDRGISNALNKGLMLATGDFVVFMNAGDTFYDDSTITKVLSVMENRETVIVGNALMVGRDSSTLREARLDLLFGSQTVWTTVCHQAVFFPRISATTCLYNEKLRFAMDLQVYYRLAEMGVQFRAIPLVVCRYKLGGITSNDELFYTKAMEHYRIRIDFNKHPNIFSFIFVVTKGILGSLLRRTVLRRINSSRKMTEHER